MIEPLAGVRPPLDKRPRKCRINAVFICVEGEKGRLQNPQSWSILREYSPPGPGTPDFPQKSAENTWRNWVLVVLVVVVVCVCVGASSFQLFFSDTECVLIGGVDHGDQK